MCGIIFAKRKSKRVSNIIQEAYLKQKSRGSEGFGYIAVDYGVARIERATEEKDILRMLSQETAPEIMFHHRKPTSTDNLIFATHPIVVSNKGLKYDYMVIHNGVIQTPSLARDRHKKIGFEYTTEHIVGKSVTHLGQVFLLDQHTKFNDSESLAIELALFEEGVITDINVAGTIAFMMYQIEKGTNRVIKRIWGHNTGNPLFYRPVKHKKGNYDIFHSHNDGEAVPTGVIFWENYDDSSLHSMEVHIGTTYKNPTVQEPRMGFTLPAATPRVRDFKNSEDAYSYGYDQLQLIDENIIVLESEREYWRGELLTVRDLSESEAIREEIAGINRKLEKKMREYDELDEQLSGVPSPYQRDIRYEED